MMNSISTTRFLLLVSVKLQFSSTLFCSSILLYYLVQHCVQFYFFTTIRFYIRHGVLLSQCYQENSQSAYDLQDHCTFFKIEEVGYKQHDGQAKKFGLSFCVFGALLMSIYKGPIIFKGLVSKETPPNSMLPSKCFCETSLWGLKGGVLINGPLEVFVSSFSLSLLASKLT